MKLLLVALVGCVAATLPKASGGASAATHATALDEHALAAPSASSQKGGFPSPPARARNLRRLVRRILHIGVQQTQGGPAQEGCPSDMCFCMYCKYIEGGDGETNKNFVHQCDKVKHGYGHRTKPDYDTLEEARKSSTEQVCLYLGDQQNIDCEEACTQCVHITTLNFSKALPMFVWGKENTEKLQKYNQNNKDCKRMAAHDMADGGQGKAILAIKKKLKKPTDYEHLGYKGWTLVKHWGSARSINMEKEEQTERETWLSPIVKGY